MNKPIHADNSLYRQYAPIALWINGCIVFGLFLLLLLIPAINEPPHSYPVADNITYALAFWCVFCLPISTIPVAAGAWRRRYERRAKMFFGCSMFLLAIWMSLVLLITVGFAAH
jgi:hypothetical protein